MRVKLDKKEYRVLNGFDMVYDKYAVSDDTGVMFFFGAEEEARNVFYSNQRPSKFYLKGSLGYWWNTTDDKAVNLSILED